MNCPHCNLEHPQHRNDCPNLPTEVEAAFREGYKAGYNNGGSDAASYEWGGGSKHAATLLRDETSEWEQSDAKKAQDVEKCPACGSEDIGTRHRDGDFALPETDWKQCEQCDHQWGHQ